MVPSPGLRSVVPSPNSSRAFGATLPESVGRPKKQGGGGALKVPVVFEPPQGHRGPLKLTIYIYHYISYIYTSTSNWNWPACFFSFFSKELYNTWVIVGELTRSRESYDPTSISWDKIRVVLCRFHISSQLQSNEYPQLCYMVQYDLRHISIIMYVYSASSAILYIHLRFYSLK